VLVAPLEALGVPPVHLVPTQARKTSAGIVPTAAGMVPSSALVCIQQRG
jgi:hypothetical protein